MVETEVKRVARGHINQIHIGVVHRELAKAQSPPTIRHEISRSYRSLRLAGAEHQHKLIACDFDRRKFSLNARQRQDFLWIEDQIVTFGTHTLHFASVDQLGNV